MNWSLRGDAPIYAQLVEQIKQELAKAGFKLVANQQ